MLSTRCSGLAVLAALAMGLHLDRGAQAATLPVSATFAGGSSDGFTFTAAANSAWTIPNPPDVARLTLTATAEATANLGSIQVTDDLSATDFTVSATMVFNSLTSTASGAPIVDTGLMLFGNDATLTGGYILDFNTNTNKIRIVNADGGTQTSVGSMTYDPGEVYTLTIQGTHPMPGVLNLSFTLNDPSSGDVTVTASDTTLLAGQYFGFRSRTGAAPGTTTFTGELDVDNFSMTAVPEPHSALIAGLAAIGVAVAVRCRTRR